jgi:DNA-binding IclR family transcriptional regulator
MAILDIETPTSAGAVPTGLIQSLQRGLRVFDYVASADEPVVAKQVARALGLNLSTAYHLLTTLEHEGYVARTANRAYQPVLRIEPRPSASHATGREMVQVQRLLGRAAFAVDDVAALWTLAGHRVRVLASAAVPAADSAAWLDQRRCQAIPWSAAGVAMLSVLDAQDRDEAILAAARCAAARQELFCEETIRSWVAEAATAGVAITSEEGHANVAVAVPMAHGCPTVVSIVALARRVERERERLTNIVRQLAAVMARAPRVVAD